MNGMRLYAHRGLSGEYPENTMISFQHAAEARFDGIELDVQLTRDGQLVVIHDETVDRTTDGSGKVLSYSLAELRQLNAAKVKPRSADVARIPSFEEYCEWAADQGRDAPFVTNIELKSSIIYYPEIEEKTFEMLQRYGLENRVFFSSFNHLSILRMKQIAPSIPCGALVEEQGLMFAGFYCERFGFDYFHPGLPSVTEGGVAECHAHGIPVHVWTVDAPADLARMRDYGVDGVFTNFTPQN